MVETKGQLTVTDAIIHLKQCRQRLFNKSRRFIQRYGWTKCSIAVLAIVLRLKMINDEMRVLGVDTRQESFVE